jgi:quercetin dioxygenase-like cupin family protein
MTIEGLSPEDIKAAEEKLGGVFWAPELAGEARRKSDRTFVREVRGKYSEMLKKHLDEPRVYPSKEMPYHGGPQFFSKSIVRPGKVPTTQLFETHIETFSPGGHGQKHGHMNGATFYILDGEGYDIHDGVRYDWKAGDVCIVEPGCVHQHFNADPDHPAKCLVIKSKPIYLFANLMFQDFVESAPKESVKGWEGWEPHTSY